MFGNSTDDRKYNSVVCDHPYLSFVLQHYLDDVPLSRILTIENRVKQMAPKPVNTRAGIK